MKSAILALASAAVAGAAFSGSAAEPKKYGFDRPLVIVAEEPDAYLADEGSAMTKEGLEQYADGILAGGKVTHVFWCPVAGRANYDSKAAEPVWAGLGKPETVWGIEKKVQGVSCSGATPEQAAANKRWAENAKKLHDAGIDPYKVWIDRTHAKGAEAWISVRMTDLQYCYVANYFRTPSFFAKRAELVSEPAEHGGGSPKFWEPEVREWLKRVIVEVAERYSDADGIEFDFVSANDTPYFTHEGVRAFDAVAMNRYIEELSKAVKGIVRNPKFRTGLRVLPDTNELTCRNMTPRGTDILFPCLDGVRATGQAVLCREWHEIDLVGPRAMPGIDVRRLSADRLAGWISWMRGWEFPGVMLLHVSKANPAIRDGVFSGALVDWDKTVRGPRRLDLLRDAHMFEWKFPCADWRVRYPWKLDRPWKYEFALQEGSVAEKRVTVIVIYEGEAAPETILLNGYKSLSSKRTKDQVFYTFAPDSILNWRNHLYIPAQEDAKSAATVVGAVVRIDN